MDLKNEEEHMKNKKSIKSFGDYYSNSIYLIE